MGDSSDQNTSSTLGCVNDRKVDIRCASEGPSAIAHDSNGADNCASVDQSGPCRFRSSRLCRLRSFTERLRHSGFRWSRDGAKSTANSQHPSLFGFKQSKKEADHRVNLSSTDDENQHSSYKKVIGPLSDRRHSLRELVAQGSSNFGATTHERSTSTSPAAPVERIRPSLASNKNHKSTPSRSVSFSRIHSLGDRMNRFIASGKSAISSRSNGSAKKLSCETVSDHSSTEHVTLQNDTTNTKLLQLAHRNIPEIHEESENDRLKMDESGCSWNLNHGCDRSHFKTNCFVDSSQRNVFEGTSDRNLNGSYKEVANIILPVDGPTDVLLINKNLPNENFFEVDLYCKKSSSSSFSIDQEGVAIKRRSHCSLHRLERQAKSNISTDINIPMRHTICSDSATVGDCALYSRLDANANDLPSSAVSCQNNTSAYTTRYGRLTKLSRNGNLADSRMMPNSTSDYNDHYFHETFKSKQFDRLSSESFGSEEVEFGVHSPERSQVTFHLGPDIEEDEGSNQDVDSLGISELDGCQKVSPTNSSLDCVELDYLTNKEKYLNQWSERARSSNLIEFRKITSGNSSINDQRVSEQDIVIILGEENDCESVIAKSNREERCNMNENDTFVTSKGESTDNQEKQLKASEKRTRTQNMRFAEGKTFSETYPCDYSENLQPIPPFICQNVTNAEVSSTELKKSLLYLRFLLSSEDRVKECRKKCLDNRNFSQTYDLSSESSELSQEQSTVTHDAELRVNRLPAFSKLKSRSLSPIKGSPDSIKKIEGYQKPNQIYDRFPSNVSKTIHGNVHGLADGKGSRSFKNDAHFNKSSRPNRFRKIRTFLEPNQESLSSSSSDETRISFHRGSCEHNDPLRVGVHSGFDDSRDNRSTQRSYCNLKPVYRKPSLSPIATQRSLSSEPPRILRLSPQSFVNKGEPSRSQLKINSRKKKEFHGDMLDVRTVFNHQCGHSCSQGHLPPLSELGAASVVTSSVAASQVNTTPTGDECSLTDHRSVTPSTESKQQQHHTALLAKRPVAKLPARQNSAPIVTRQLSPPDYHSQSAANQKTRRLLIVEELVGTETAYLEGLQLMMRFYYRLQDATLGGVIEKSTLDSIFYMIPELSEIHTDFLCQLSYRLQNWSPSQTVADVFINKMSEPALLRVYSLFVCNWHRARTLLTHQCQHKPTLAKAVEKMERSNKKKQRLLHLLITPVQRIPHYELLLKQLAVHTPSEHADSHLLPAAQCQVHQLVVGVNGQQGTRHTHRQCRQQQQQQQQQQQMAPNDGGHAGKLNSLNFCQRQVVRRDLVTVVSPLGARRKRVLLLLSHSVVLALDKQRSAASSKVSPSANRCAGVAHSGAVDLSKYKALMKFPIENCSITPPDDEDSRQAFKEVTEMRQDARTLSEMAALAENLSYKNLQVEEQLRRMSLTLSSQLAEKLRVHRKLAQLQLTVSNRSAGKTAVCLHFGDMGQCLQWQEAFAMCRSRVLSPSSVPSSPGAQCHVRRAINARQCPDTQLVRSLPVLRSRSGLQLTCAAMYFDTPSGQPDSTPCVWACSSDGYMGQVCLLRPKGETVDIQCYGICNSRIMCITHVPCSDSTAANSTSTRSAPCHLTSSSDSEPNECDNTKPVAAKGRLLSELYKVPTIPPFKSRSSPAVPLLRELRPPVRMTSCAGSHRSSAAPAAGAVTARSASMWLGTEEGCLYIFSCRGDPSSSRVRLQLAAAVSALVYHRGRVFVGLASGTLLVYRTDAQCEWLLSAPVSIAVSQWRLDHMCVLADELWLVCRNCLTVIELATLQTRYSGVLETPEELATATESVRVECMAADGGGGGGGVWLVFSGHTCVCLVERHSYRVTCKVDIATSVVNMLYGCEPLVRQHKAACLRVTSLATSCCQLWAGTSAGVIVQLSPTTINSSSTPTQTRTATALSTGHSGQGRFMISAVSSAVCSGRGCYHFHCHIKSGPVGSEEIGSHGWMVSGGDGREQFGSAAAVPTGYDDSTNHILLWKY